MRNIDMNSKFKDEQICKFNNVFKPKLDTSGQNWTVTWTEIGRPWTASYQRLWTFWILKLGKNKKFSLTFFKIFLTFFLKFRVFCEKRSYTKGLEGIKPVQVSVQFRPILQKHVQIVDFHQKLQEITKFLSKFIEIGIHLGNL